MIDPRSSSPGHLDLDALADALADGGPDPTVPEADRALGASDAAHLRDCASCQDRLAELAAAEVGVVAGLATLPEPPLPDAVAERLASSLRAAGAPAPSTARAGSARVVPLRPRRAWLPSVAAAVALVLAGGLAVSALPNGAGDTDSADTAASSAGGSSEESGTDSDTSGGAGGGSGAEAQSGPAPGPAAMALDALTGVRSGSSRTDYADDAALRARLPQLLVLTAMTGTSTQRSTPPPGAAAAPVPSAALSGRTPAAPPTASRDDDRATSGSPLRRLDSPDVLAQCLSALQASAEVAAARTGPPAGGDAPLAVDRALLGGAPALAVVLPDGDPRQVVVAVVGPACSGTDPDVQRVVRTPRP